MWVMLLAAILVVDGDTIKQNGDRIRIVGIDAPETYYARCEAERWLGRLAKRHLQKLLADGKVEVRPIRYGRGKRAGQIARDKYERILAQIFVEGRNVSKTMVQDGYARRRRSRKRNWWCQSLRK